MDPVINTSKPDDASIVNPDKVQPWKVFLNEPEVRPFAAAEAGDSSVMRLKTEKDEHGLGG